MPEIKKDKRNYRVHTDENKQLISKSLTELGAGRSILLDNQQGIIAGNGVFEQWGDRPIRIIETDGKELIALKRKDLAPDDPKRQKLAFADNYTSDTSKWDTELLELDKELLNLGEWGFDFEFPEEATAEELYTKNISSPCYEPSAEKPKISELIDTHRVNLFISKINRSGISGPEKEFLIKAAFRHNIFNYSKIADYYANSEKEMQELMEEMALVIIDYQKALQLGYVRLSDKISKQYKDEHDE